LIIFDIRVVISISVTRLLSLSLIQDHLLTAWATECRPTV